MKVPCEVIERLEVLNTQMLHKMRLTSFTPEDKKFTS